MYKLIQANEAEYQQRTLQEMKDSKFWQSGKQQYVTYATSADYYKMEHRGFDTVYIEDGCGDLDNKGGIWTIGRDKLAGVPKDINTVIVDKDGNWRYIANSGSRASYVEDIRNKQYALTAIYENKLRKSTTSEAFTKVKIEQLEKEIQKLDKIANKSRKQEDFDKLQAAIEQWNTYSQYNHAARSKTAQICAEWAQRYNIFEEASRKYTKWTVEDEERYNNLREAIVRAGNIKHIYNSNHNN